MDATCPLVSKVHRESELLYRKGYDLILIGHNNHPEVIGTMGQLPKGAIKLVETMEDAKALADNIKDRLEHRSAIASHFVASLELVKEGKLILRQDDEDNQIYVSLKS